MKWLTQAAIFLTLVQGRRADVYDSFQRMQSYALHFQRADGTPEAYSAPVASNVSISAPLISHMPGNLSSFATVQPQDTLPQYPGTLLIIGPRVSVCFTA